MALIASAIPCGNEPINGKNSINYQVSIIDTNNPNFGVRFTTSVLTSIEQPAQIEAAARAQIIVDASSPAFGNVVLATNDIRFT